MYYILRSIVISILFLITGGNIVNSEKVILYLKRFILYIAIIISLLLVIYPGYEDLLQNIYIDVGTRIALFIVTLHILKKFNSMDIVKKIKKFINEH